MAFPNQLCIRRWTTKHVAVWLKDEGFFEYVDILCNKHRLDGITLLTLTEYDLRSPPLEIKVLGDIKRLMLSVRKLQKIHIDVLEEMGYNSDSPMSSMSPFISALQNAEWLCNGEPSHDCDGPITDLNSDQYQYVNGKNKHSIRRLDPEYWKTILSCIYVFIVFGFTSFIMVIVHERVPDMQTYPPLPDIFLDSVPRIPWAFAMTEVCGMILCYIWLLVLLLHKHRSPAVGEARGHVMRMLKQLPYGKSHMITSPRGLAMATSGQTCPRPMCIPPSYADLGKAARDIFNKGFGFGLVKLDVKTKSCSGVEFSTSGSSNTDTGKVTGTLETKYKWCEYGLTFTEKWNTDNTLGTEIAIEDQICQGLKLTFDTTFSPNTGKKSGKIKSSYKRECMNLGCDVDFDFAGPAIHGSAVFCYEGWLAGYQMTFDSAKSKLTRNNFAVGYRTGDFQLHTNVNDGTEFGGSIYQKVCEDLDTSVNLAWTSGTNCTRFGIAAKYQLDPTASISAKVNNSSLIGVGYTQTLRPGVKLTLSALVDGKSINAGGHKLGLALELEA
ncbi:voltage-dependent anion-selective channel protein 2 isoform X1 [Orcinus orca]|uniref:voltage-dependent anion-selective channel protein 2 isoform X1 n=1 Tax=Orcinus orca TaxID=9733 RepID=UPI0021129B5E|nr:voltage-dependent anion-selective channel protein 2 isoform X1 [Orcinus orca]